MNFLSDTSIPLDLRLELSNAALAQVETHVALNLVEEADGHSYFLTCRDAHEEATQRYTAALTAVTAHLKAQ